MGYELVKSRDEALELLEADLITIQLFIDICHKNGWKLADVSQEGGDLVRILPDSPANTVSG